MQQCELLHELCQHTSTVMDQFCVLFHIEFLKLVGAKVGRWRFMHPHLYLILCGPCFKNSPKDYLLRCNPAILIRLSAGTPLSLNSTLTPTAPVQCLQSFNQRPRSGTVSVGL
jgi:hypothetical protein